MRRAVLGDEWVDKSLASRNALTGEFQNFITRIAWGEIWTRPGLDQRTRRLAGARHHGLAQPLGGVFACICALESSKARSRSTTSRRR